MCRSVKVSWWKLNPLRGKSGTGCATIEREAGTSEEQLHVVVEMEQQ